MRLWCFFIVPCLETSNINTFFLRSVFQSIHRFWCILQIWNVRTTKEESWPGEGQKSPFFPRERELKRRTSSDRTARKGGMVVVQLWQFVPGSSHCYGCRSEICVVCAWTSWEWYVVLKYWGKFIIRDAEVLVWFLVLKVCNIVFSKTTISAVFFFAFIKPLHLNKTGELMLR